MSDFSNMAMDFLRKGQVPQANEMAMRAVKATPDDWHARFALGQCFQTANQWAQASNEYAAAARLKPGDKTILLTLGIARQKDRKYNESIAALQDAVFIDREYDLAHNSLGISFKLLHNLPAALGAFDAGLNGAAANLAKSLRNQLDGLRYPFRLTRHSIWLEHVAHAADQICLRDGIHMAPVMPTEEQMNADSRTSEFRGIFWEDFAQPNGLQQRHFRPNFRNALFELLRARPTYVALLRNRAAVLHEMGKRDVARAYEDEAADFS
jgi:tetratricopeptide (TPR) repeat protein